MNDQSRLGNVSLWKSNSENPKAPAAKGECIAHRDLKEGESVEIALWRNKSDNPKAPKMKGKISDKRDGGQQSQQGRNQGESGASADFDDGSDIPF